MASRRSGLLGQPCLPITESHTLGPPSLNELAIPEPLEAVVHRIEDVPHRAFAREVAAQAIRESSTRPSRKIAIGRPLAVVTSCLGP
jgi:hypothetical protein